MACTHICIIEEWTAVSGMLVDSLHQPWMLLLLLRSCCVSGSAGISDVDMAVDDAEAEDTSNSAAVVADQVAHAQQQSAAAAVSRSRWDTADPDDALQSSVARAASSTTGGRQAAGADTTSTAGAVSSDQGGEGVDRSRPKKKQRANLSVDVSSVDIDHEALLAGVNQELEELDAAEAGVSAAAGAAGRGPGDLGTASSMSVGGSLTSGGSRGWDPEGCWHAWEREEKGTLA